MTDVWTSRGLVELEALPFEAMSANSIGRSLAKINRFAGQTPVPWSVAAHSLLVAKLCPHPEEQAWGLLHDAHEAFLGDIITPTVDFMLGLSRGTGAFEIERALSEAKVQIDRQIRVAWGLNGRSIDFEEVAHFDRIALEAETFVFFGRAPGKDPTGDFDRAISLMREFEGLTNWVNATAHWIDASSRLDGLGALSRPLIHPEPAF